MNKLVAVIQIKGLASGIVYAEKFDEIEETIHRHDVSQFKNLKTGELFDTRNENVRMVDEFTIASYTPEKEVSVYSTGRKTKSQLKNEKVQTSLF